MRTARTKQPDATYITQRLKVLERDYSHPSIAGWCPLNESWQRLHDRITILDDVTRRIFLATKAFDSTCPGPDTFGYPHRVMETDVYDKHSYAQDPAALARQFKHFGGLCAVLLDHPQMFGYCCTQLTNVYQEQNGLCWFDRRPKLDLKRLCHA